MLRRAMKICHGRSWSLMECIFMTIERLLLSEGLGAAMLETFIWFQMNIAMFAVVELVSLDVK